ncbi:hypothetical protein [Mycobacterium helveticum]|uniref:Uncharacterized protein n=1 Tax=Mycobacterium helveticum TaxID=2592811 RepID=A0A557XVF9_9MYCO|nr:hypothetical protein [Mycobacterium helveticum]TVS86042.1 hypothetical protein FPZ46_12640 [Mycobacterium helveticum]TVS90019.1 hypothetical protein FPZ47_10805 [Mycobacterium helveticum]
MARRMDRTAAGGGQRAMIPGAYEIVREYRAKEKTRWAGLPEDPVRDEEGRLALHFHGKMYRLMQSAHPALVPVWALRGYQTFAAEAAGVDWLGDCGDVVLLHPNDEIEPTSQGCGATYFTREGWEAAGNKPLLAGN